MFILILFGSIEASNLIHVRESLCVASYEGARQVTGPEGSTEAAATRAREIMESRGFDNITVTFSPADLSTVVAGDSVTVTVSVPTSSQTMLPVRIYGQSNLSATSSFVKE